MQPGKKLTPIHWIFTVIGLVLMFCNQVVEPFNGLTEIGVSCMGIFLGTIILMLVLDNLRPVFLSILAFCFCGVYTWAGTLTNYFGTDLFWFMVTLFVMMAAVEESGLIKRLAIWFLTREITKKNPWFVVLMLLVASLVIGSFLNSSALMIILVSLLAQILESLNIKKASKTSGLLVMATLAVVAVSHAATPIGHPTAVNGITQLSNFGLGELNYGTFSMVGIPFNIVWLIIVMLVLKFVFRLDVNDLKNYDPDMLKGMVGAPSKKEKFCAAILVFVIVLWMAPSFMKMFPATLAAGTWLGKFGTTGPVIIGILLMSMVPLEEGRPMMTLAEGMSKVPWAPCACNAVASGLSTALNHPDGGVKDFFANTFGPALEGLSPFLVLLALCLLCSYMTSFTTNILSGTVAMTIGFSLIGAGVVDLNPVAMAMALTICSCAAFATPPAAAYAAVTAGSGLVSPGNQMKIGLFMDTLVALLTSTVAYGLANIML